MDSTRTRKIAIVNEKGGVGKTVTTINCGAALAALGKRVLIVDVDPQANATKGVGLIPDDLQYSIYDMIISPENTPASLIVKETSWKGLDIAPSHPDLSAAELELLNSDGRENRIKDGLVQVENQYDFILLDTPPSLSILTVNVLVFANEVLVPCQTHPYAYSALDSLLETVNNVRENLNPKLKIRGVVATCYDHRTRVGRAVLDALKNDSRLSGKLFDSVIRSNITIAESAFYGKPVIFYDKTSPGSLDYLSLAKELISRK
ncbi:MAG: ParA family protein [Pseudomonadota bacterium]